jgi:DNA-binding LacI/PurR family transcriptional regulator
VPAPAQGFLLRSTFHAELVEELQAAADQCGYDLLLSPVTHIRDEPRAIETLLESRCEALILISPEAPATRITAIGEQLPVVVVGRRTASPVDVIRAADDDGIGLAVDHLVRLGHRDIVHVDGGGDVVATDRRRGYRKAMRRHGLTNHLHVIPGAYTEEAGARAARTLLDAERLPTAVVAANDHSAIGLLGAFHRAGVAVPGAVSIVGYDDSPVARLAAIDLTSVSQQHRQQAQHAVTAAIERLDGSRTHPREVVFTPQLVQRHSTGPAPSGLRPDVSPARLVSQ